MTSIKELLKDIKVEWKPLGEIATISGAGVDKKSRTNEKQVVLLNYMDVYRNNYLTKEIPKMIVTANDDKIVKCNVIKGDIFITPSSETKNDIFRSSVVIADMNNVVYSYHIIRLRLNVYNLVTSCYLSYLFQSESYRKRIYKYVNGNTRKTIAKSYIEKLEVPIPPLSRSLQLEKNSINTIEIIY